jgi:hypothetical protein
MLHRVLCTLELFHQVALRISCSFFLMVNLWSRSSKLTQHLLVESFRHFHLQRCTLFPTRQAFKSFACGALTSWCLDCSQQHECDAIIIIHHIIVFFYSVQITIQQRACENRHQIMCRHRQSTAANQHHESYRIMHNETAIRRKHVAKNKMPCSFKFHLRVCSLHISTTATNILTNGHQTNLKQHPSTNTFITALH